MLFTSTPYCGQSGAPATIQTKNVAMATVQFANLASAANWRVDKNHAAKFVDGLPRFPAQFPSLGALVVPKEYLEFFPKKLLLRRGTIDRWNSIVSSQQEFDVNGQAGIYASCLSASCGMGKSMEAYLYACLARQCGWFLQYIGNGALWNIGKSKEAEIDSAKMYLEMTQAFNQSILDQACRRLLHSACAVVV